MKTTFFLLYIILLFSFPASSQQFTSTFSDEEYNMFNSIENAVPAKNGKIVLQLKNEGFAWVPSTTRIDASLLLVDNKMKIIKKADINFQKNHFIEIKGLYQAAGKTILVYAFKNERKDKEYTISAIRINEEDLSAKGEVELGRFSAFTGADIPDYQLKYSVDSSEYFLFVEADQKKKEPKQFYAGVFSSTLDKVFEKNAQLEADNRKVMIQSVTLDNNNNIFIEYRQYEKDVLPEDVADEDVKTPAFVTVLSHFTKDAVTPHEIAFNLNGNLLHSSRIVMNNTSGKLCIAGTYKATAKGRVTGIFYCEYDAAEKKVSNAKLNDIPSDMLALLDKDKVGSDGKKDPGISGNFKAKRLSYRNNGTIDFTLEYNKLMQGYTMVNSKQYDFATYYSQTILNVNISQQGTMIFTRIPKNQLSGGKDFLSHFSFYSGNNLVFLYNDHKDNIERDVNKAPEEISEPFRKSVLMAATVDEKGNLKRQVVYEHGDDKYATLPTMISAFNSSTFFVLKRKVGSFIAIEHTKFGIIGIKL